MFEFLNFPGGLTQSDWFGLLTGIVGTGYGVTSYNQAAYTSNVGFHQAQLYQKINYHLGWIAIARDDIREMASIVVNRIDNYNLVATLIMALAADSVLGVEFDASAPGFVVHAFFLSTGLSIAFFALSIMFGIKGQNSAFLNTMRLLTWEFRPENPAQYDHDYMKQAQQYEKDGLREMFRIPGFRPHYHRHEQAKDSATSRPTFSDGVPLPAEHKETALEELNPETSQLLYLARFARFMSLWLPYEWQSKVCIGLGLISLSQGAAYFSLARFANDSYRNMITCVMVAIFVFITLMIMVHNQKEQTLHKQWLEVVLFVWGPVSATFATLITKPSWIQRVLAPACLLGHVIFYLAVFGKILRNQKPIGSMKCVEGPHGQQFSEGWEFELERTMQGPGTRVGKLVQAETGFEEAAQAGAQERTAGDLRACSWGGHAPGYGAPAPDFRASQRNLHQQISKEMAKAQRLQDRVYRTVLSFLALAAFLWACVFVETSLEKGLGSIIDTHPAKKINPLDGVDLPFLWPSKVVGPHAISCMHDQVFVANRYQIFRVSTQDGALLTEPCNVDGVITDIATTCNQGGLCWPMVLLSGSPSRVLDCSSGESFFLVQEPIPAERFALHSADPTSPLNGTLLARHGKLLVEYRWQNTRRSWTPIWEYVESGEHVGGIDLRDSQFFIFREQSSSEFPATVDVHHLSSQASIGMWQWHQNERLISGCAMDLQTVLLLTGSPNAIRLVRASFPTSQRRR